MDILIPDDVRRSPRMMAAADRIGKLLEIELSDLVTDDPVSAEVGIYSDTTGRTGLDLAIADPTGTASARFPSDKLSDDGFLVNQVRDVWCDLLWTRSRAYRARLKEHLASMVDEG